MLKRFYDQEYTGMNHSDTSLTLQKCDIMCSKYYKRTKIPVKIIRRIIDTKMSLMPVKSTNQ